MERFHVRLRDLRSLRAELRLEELDRRLDRTPVEPRHQAEREHVLRALGLARRHALDVLERADGERGERHLVHLVLVERAVVERIRGVAGLLQVALVEGVGVDDQRAALRQVPDVRLQRRRIHRDEHVGRVAGREDVVVGEVELEPRDARQRAGRRTDLRREVGQRRDVVPEQRRLRGELRAGELHAVAGVAREADDHLGELLDWLGQIARPSCSETLRRSDP